MGTCAVIQQVFDDTAEGVGLDQYFGEIQTYMELSLTFMEALPGKTFHMFMFIYSARNIVSYTIVGNLF